MTWIEPSNNVLHTRKLSSDARRFRVFEDERSRGKSPVEAWKAALIAFPTKRLMKWYDPETGVADVPDAYVRTTMVRAMQRYAPSRLEQATAEVQTELSRTAGDTIRALQEVTSGLRPGGGSELETKEDASIAAVRVKAAEVTLKALKVLDGGKGGGGATNIQVNVGERNAVVRGVFADPESHAAVLEMQRKLRKRGQVKTVDAEVRGADE